MIQRNQDMEGNAVFKKVPFQCFEHYEWNSIHLHHIQATQEEVSFHYLKTSAHNADYLNACIPPGGKSCEKFYSLIICVTKPWLKTWENKQTNK